MNQTQVVNQFQEHRPLLFNIAYRMLGTAMEAEDMVQETYLRWREVEFSQVENPRAFLTTIVTRLAIDHLRSAQVRRETYPGPWLPEPVFTSSVAGPDDTVAMKESLSIAYLLMLERLSPTQRAAFVLHDLFDYDYAEVAAILETSEANSRQLVSRARSKMAAEPQVPLLKAEEEEAELLQQFISASIQGDVEIILELLAPDVTLVADGGGKVPSAMAPLHGAEAVSRLMVGIGRMAAPGMYLRVLGLNGQNALAVYQPDGWLEMLYFPVVRDSRLQALYIMRNPDKLRLPEEIVRQESEPISLQQFT